jgi:hypothetical protein
MACVVRPPGLNCGMRKPSDRSVNLLTSLASAAATAYALAYLAHSEWGFSRIRIREDALALAGFLVIVLSLKAVFWGKKNKGS